MSKTLIVIPSRMKAVRLPNKPLKLINSIPMVVQVYNRAIESKVGEVIIATPDKEIIEVGKKFSCNTILTKNIYNTGTDRVFAAYNEIKDKKFNYIINLQGDMPNINPSCIRKLNNIIKKKKLKFAP